MCSVHSRYTEMCFCVSEKLDKGLVLPRIKQAQLVNSVLKVEQVGISTNVFVIWKRF